MTRKRLRRSKKGFLTSISEYFTYSLGKGKGGKGKSSTPPAQQLAPPPVPVPLPIQASIEPPKTETPEILSDIRRARSLSEEGRNKRRGLLGVSDEGSTVSKKFLGE